MHLRQNRQNIMKFCTHCIRENLCHLMPLPRSPSYQLASLGSRRAIPYLHHAFRNYMEFRCFSSALQLFLLLRCQWRIEFRSTRWWSVTMGVKSHEPCLLRVQRVVGTQLRLSYSFIDVWFFSLLFSSPSPSQKTHLRNTTTAKTQIPIATFTPVDNPSLPLSSSESDEEVVASGTSLLEGNAGALLVVALACGF